MKGYRASHQYIVVMTLLGGISAVRQLLVHRKLMAGLGVALHIQPVAHGLHKTSYHHGLGAHVGMKTYAAAVGARQAVERPARIQIGILLAYTVQHKEIAVGSTAVLSRLEGIALYHKESVTVIPCHSHTLGGKKVVVDMPAPLGHDFGNSVRRIGVAVKDTDDREISVAGASADIDTDYIVTAGRG